MIINFIADYSGINENKVNTKIETIVIVFIRVLFIADI